MAFADDYVDVASRIAEFRAKHPEGTLQATVLRWPEDGFPFIAVEARAYRIAGDPTPGVGLAYEPFPGKTNFTRDSELQNAETSAWGRAIVAVGAADTKKGVASADEVRNRRSTGAGQAPVPAARPTEAHTEAPVEQRTTAVLSAAAGESSGGGGSTLLVGEGAQAPPSDAPTFADLVKAAGGRAQAREAINRVCDLEYSAKTAPLATEEEIAITLAALAEGVSA